MRLAEAREEMLYHRSEVDNLVSPYLTCACTSLPVSLLCDDLPPAVLHSESHARGEEEEEGSPDPSTATRRRQRGAAMPIEVSLALLYRSCCPQAD